VVVDANASLADPGIDLVERHLLRLDIREND